MYKLLFVLCFLFSASAFAETQCQGAVETISTSFPTQEDKVANELDYYNVAAVALMSDCKDQAEGYYAGTQVPAIIDASIKECERASNQMSDLYLADCFEKAARLAATLMPN